MLELKPMTAVPLEDAVAAWDKGFEGYFVNMTMSVDSLVRIMHMDGIQLPLSWVAYVEGEPVGISLNGVRTINGTQYGWAGPVAVAKPYRLHPLAVVTHLLNASHSSMLDQGVDVVLSEVLSENQNMLRGMLRTGYRQVGSMLHHVHNGGWPDDPFATAAASSYRIESVPVFQVRSLPFLRTVTSWQSQWKNIMNAQAIIVSDADGKPVGYAIYRPFLSDDETAESVRLFQCEVAPGREDQQDLARVLLSKVFGPYTRDIPRRTHDLPASNEVVLQVLEEAGFQVALQQELLIAHRENIKLIEVKRGARGKTSATS
ncbi:MAG: hypothetical protein WCC10_00360 [Tumebacillaceae bacterium]